MKSTTNKEDQAQPLRRRSQQRHTETKGEKQESVSSLPPRKEAHKNTRKKMKLRLHFPLARLLLIIFIMIVFISVFAPLWMEW